MVTVLTSLPTVTLQSAACCVTVRAFAGTTIKKAPISQGFFWASPYKDSLLMIMRLALSTSVNRLSTYFGSSFSDFIQPSR